MDEVNEIVGQRYALGGTRVRGMEKIEAAIESGMSDFSLCFVETPVEARDHYVCSLRLALLNLPSDLELYQDDSIPTIIPGHVMIIRHHAISSTTAASRARSFRQLHISPPIPRSHDVLARFRPPSPAHPALPTANGEIASQKPAEAFETASTEPAGTSFQEVPPPDVPLDGPGHLAIPVPAMKDSTGHVGGTDKGKEKIERRGPTIVQGVEIPAKPIPPGEEGKSFRPLLFAFIYFWLLPLSELLS